MPYYNSRGILMPESAPESGRVQGTSAGNETSTAPAGNTSVSGEGGGDLMIGSSGDNRFWITHPSDKIQEQPGGGIDTLTAWWETELHSEAEQAALRYAEALTRAADTDRDTAFQRFHDALAEHFSPQEILEIVAVVVNMNVWTRIKLAEGAMPGPAG